MTTPTAADSFVHLHVHTEYSMLDGAARAGQAVRAHRRDGHAGAGDDRPRQRVRRARLLPAGPGRRGQPDHRHGGLPHPEHLPVRADQGALGRRRRGRRLRRPARTPTSPCCRSRPRACTTCSGWRPGRRWRASSTSRGPTGSCSHEYAEGPDRHHRLPVRRDPDLAADRQLREGAGQRGRVPGHLRQGELLPGADGPRPRHRDQGPGRPAPAGQGPAAADGRHQRPALHRRRRRRRARGAAVCAVRQDHGRPEPVQVRRPRLLPQVARRDARPVGRQVPAARGLRQHPADRRALRGRRSTSRRPTCRGSRCRTGRPSRPGSSRRSDAGSAVRFPDGIPPEVQKQADFEVGVITADELPRLLPGGRRLHQLGQGQRHPGRSRPRFRRRFDGRLRHADHRPEPAAARADLRAVPQPRPGLDARLRRGLR